MSALEITAYVVLGVMLLVLGLIFFKPLKGIFAMLIQSALGGAGLYIFNLILSGTGFSIAINIVTASVCGLFGLPGFILLVLSKFLFTYL